MNFSEISRFFRPFAGGRLLVGFSGGADSTAALLITLRAAAPLGIAVEAVHCEHGLRGADSLADAAWCRAFCAARSIPFRCETLDVPEHRRAGENLESAARRLRLACWRRLAEGDPRAAVVLGHHRDDRRENLLLRLSRGSNASGLTGLRRRTVVEGITLLRPLLGVSRREIEDFLHRESIDDWRRDATNGDRTNQRNFLRGDLLPRWERAFPFVAAGLDRALDALEEDARYLEAEAERVAAGLSEPWRIAEWRALPPPLQTRVLRNALRARMPDLPPPDGALFRRFRAMLKRETPETRRLPLGGGRALAFRGGVFAPDIPLPRTAARRWRWRTEPDACFAVRFLAGPPDWRDVSPERACFDAAELPPELLIESGRDGETMTVFGGRRVKWKKLRIDRGVARRDAPPLLRLPDGEPIWSPGIRHGAFAPITSATAEWVEFRLRNPLSDGGKTWQPPNS